MGIIIVITTIHLIWQRRLVQYVVWLVLQLDQFGLMLRGSTMVQFPHKSLQIVTLSNLSSTAWFKITRVLLYNSTMVVSVGFCGTSDKCTMLELTIFLYVVSNAARITHYSSVFSFGGVSLLSLFAFNFLGDKNGVRRMNGTSPASCQSITDCQAHEYCIRGSCVSTLTRYHDSYGAGLGYNYGTGLFDVVDESAPTWTESTYVVIYILCINWDTHC